MHTQIGIESNRPELNLLDLNITHTRSKQETNEIEPKSNRMTRLPGLLRTIIRLSTKTIYMRLISWIMDDIIQAMGVKIWNYHWNWNWSFGGLITYEGVYSVITYVLVQ